MLHPAVKSRIGLISGMIACYVSYRVGRDHGYSAGHYDEYVTREAHEEHIEKLMKQRRLELGVQIKYDWALRKLFTKIQQYIHSKWKLEEYTVCTECVPDNLRNEILTAMLELDEKYIRSVKSEFERYYKTHGNISNETIRTIITQVVDHETNHPSEIAMPDGYIPPVHDFSSSGRIWTIAGCWGVDD